MAQAFDFANTPITEQTTLVARYKSTDGEGFGGQWFRVTTASGAKYVPQTYEQACAFATLLDAAATGSLQNEATGLIELVAPSEVIEVELSGGWNNLLYTNISAYPFFFPICYGSSSSRKGVFSNIRRVSGYAQGLIIPDPAIHTQLAHSMFSKSEQSGSLANLDCTGLVVDRGLAPYLLAKSTGGDVNRAGGLLARYYGESNHPEVGVHGTIEVISAPLVISDFSQSFVSVFNSTAAYVKGFGFVGEYANQWVEAYPPITNNSGSYDFRNTYLG